jgi:hypothetical protein
VNTLKEFIFEEGSMDYTVTILDTGGIQDFIFGSNELRENIGASELVHRATQQWAFEVLDEMLLDQHNIVNSKNPSQYQPYKPDFRIENKDTEAAAEVLYAGGGNTVILFGGESHADLARDFVYALSKRILHEAPGLNLYAAHGTYTWKGALSLPAVIEQVLQRLGQLKGELSGALPTLGLSVSAACTSTGLPANGSHPDRDKKGTLANVANRQVHAKWPAAKEATERLRDMFEAVEEAGFLWTDNLDRLAKLPHRNDSYIAVVHADGNGMGRRIHAFNEAWKTQIDRPRQYITAMRDLSLQIADTATKALKRTINALTARLTSAEGREQYRPPYLPFRPIVFGGDDVTWVAAGPWGVSLAHRYLAELENERIREVRPKARQETGTPPYAGAGVTIVKTHYPFSRAYVLAEALARSAKGRVREVNAKKQASALDWHYTTTGLTGSLRQIREREFHTPEGHTLLMRPILLDSQYGWRNWDNFNRVATAFAYGWLDRRNKVMAVREALRGHRTAVQQFETIYGDELPEMAGSHYGWVDEERMMRCSHFDAVELVDMFFHLPTETAEEASA